MNIEPGDVIMTASHGIYANESSGITANLTGKIKFGTASRIDNMGTGQNDYSLQSDLYKVSGNFTTFGNIGYRVYGKPVGYTLNNVFFGSLGSSYKFSQATSGGAMLTTSQKTTNTGAAHTEALVFASHKVKESWKAQAYLLGGFTRSVPDWGVGISVACQF